MRRIALGATLIVVAVVVGRAVGPRLHARLMAGCERMFDQMPDEFPPKRMVSGIETLRADSARTLTLLEGQERALARLLAAAPSTETVGQTL